MPQNYTEVPWFEVGDKMSLNRWWHKFIIWLTDGCSGDCRQGRLPCNCKKGKYE